MIREPKYEDTPFYKGVSGLSAIGRWKVSYGELAEPKLEYFAG
jgi:hypothetical protein